jgi:hypothetical protein
MAGWLNTKTTAITGPRAPKPRKPGAPMIRPAVKAPAAPSVFKPGAPQATPGGASAPTPFRFPNGTAPWAPAVAATAAPSAEAFEPATDSAYGSAIAQLLANKNAAETNLVAAGRRAAEDRSRNLGLLTEGRSKSKTAVTQSANKSGLFYSGKLGKDLGDVDTDYSRRENDVNTAFGRGEEDRAAQLANLTSAFNASQRDAYQSAWERYIGQAAASDTPSTSALDDFIAKLTKAQSSNARRA